MYVLSGLILEARVVTLFFFISFLPGNKIGRPKRILVVEPVVQIKERLAELQDQKRELLGRLIDINEEEETLIGQLIRQEGRIVPIRQE